MIGVQESGIVKVDYTKEEKQDLMHVAVCSLLPENYEYEGRDQDGWPHFKLIHRIEKKGVQNQEQLLKERVIQYFKNYLN